MRPLAIIPVYNEADILPAVLRHLDQQGCEVYVLDNWSTDLSAELVSQLLGRMERWPAERPTMYEWTAILTRIEEIALERGRGRWVILHDADEIRRVPSDWSCLTLANALEIVQGAGYNAVQFDVRTFVPTDDLWKAGGNPERHFRYHRNEHVDHLIPHIKAWFQTYERVDIHTTGGHEAVFTNRQVCPHSFLLKHYPIRSQEHGERKVLQERVPRYPAQERSKQWHVQYDEFVQKCAPNFICDPKDLYKDRNNTTIVTLARGPDTFHRLADSIEMHDPSYRRIVVAAGDMAIRRPGWEVVRGTNLNVGIAAAGEDDVMLVQDSVEFIGPVVEELSDVSYLTSAEIVSAQLITGIGDDPAGVETRWKPAEQPVPLVCALLRRRGPNTAGPGQAVECRCRVLHHLPSEQDQLFNTTESTGAVAALTV